METAVAVSNVMTVAHVLIVLTKLSSGAQEGRNNAVQKSVCWAHKPDLRVPIYTAHTL